MTIDYKAGNKVPSRKRRCDRSAVLRYPNERDGTFQGLGIMSTSRQINMGRGKPSRCRHTRRVDRNNQIHRVGISTSIFQDWQRGLTVRAEAVFDYCRKLRLALDRRVRENPGFRSDPVWLADDQLYHELKQMLRMGHVPTHYGIHPIKPKPELADRLTHLESCH